MHGSVAVGMGPMGLRARQYAGGRARGAWVRRASHAATPASQYKRAAPTGGGPRRARAPLPPSAGVGRGIKSKNAFGCRLGTDDDMATLADIKVFSGTCAQARG